MADPDRVFLGWDGPVLPRVARWLLDTHGEGLADVVVLVPGRRSGRLLLAHLDDAGSRCARPTQAALVPPRIVTPGALPELFYRPAAPVAGARERLLAWCSALERRSGSASFDEAPPALDDAASSSDFGARLALARDLLRTQDELGEEGLRLADVPSRAAGALQGAGEAQRWQALAALEIEARARLERAGLRDPTAARLGALDDAAERAAESGGRHGTVVLCCVAALSGLERAFLARFAARVTALVAAPESEADLFDAWGSVVVDRWHERRVTLAPGRLVVVPRPRAQAASVARQVAEILGAGPGLATHEPAERGGMAREVGETVNGQRAADSAPHGERPGVTVCIADPSLGELVGEAMADRAIPFHDALGAPLPRSAPWRLLVAIARYVESRSMRDLALLFRHPDVERYLERRLEAALALAPAGGPEPAASTRELRDALARRDWITALDLYTTETVRAVVGEGPAGDPAGAALVAAADAALAGDLGDGTALATVGEWTRRTREHLLRIYGERALGDDEADRALARALARLGEELRAQEEAAGAHDGGPRVGLGDAVELLLAGVASETMPSESAPDAVELVGWLELPLDDAPHAVVVGLVESAAGGSEGLLTPAVRRTLGLPDRDALYARDLFFLELVATSRDATFVLARRGAQGEPIVPRRILLAGATGSLVETVLALWGEDGNEVASAGEGPENDAEDGAPRRAGWRGFGPILPSAEVALPRQLPATAFRDYLACPYRFYLRHVLGLRAMSDVPRELEPGEFGRLLHDVLGRFARTQAASSDDAAAIAQALEALLAEEVERRTGALPRVAVRLQREQLRRRLRSFARWQAGQARAGWRIVPEHVEARLEATLDVDGEPFVVVGRVDRVDGHRTLGMRLLDYKSAEQAATPEQTHRGGRRGERRWIDLQLPLYERMLREAGVGGELALGFVNLGHRLTEEPLALAEWSARDLADAIAVAIDVVRAIRARRFWPPGDPPSYADGLEGLVGDAFPDRERWLRGA